LQAVFNLLGFKLEGIEAALLRSDVFRHLHAENLHAASSVTFLHLLPVGVSANGAVKVPVNGSAGKVVRDSDFAVGFNAAGVRVDLLVRTDFLRI
jgi:hypothetical protein